MKCELFIQVPYFSVAPLCLPLSDLTPIELGLTVNIRNFVVNICTDNLLPKPEKIVWDTNLAHKYKTLLNSPDCKESLRGFLSTGVLPDQNSVDSAVKFVSNIMIETAKQAGMQIPKGAVPRRSGDSNFTRLKHPKWQDLDCNKQFRNLK